MTRRDEVFWMAQEAGLIELHIEGWAPVFQGGADDIERFAALVAAAERERCAKVCDESEIPFDISVWINSTKRQMTGNVAHALAEKIRALKDEVSE